MGNKLLEILLAKTGRSAATTPSTSKLGKLFRGQGVPETVELQRVLNLPRREWQVGITGSPEEMVELLTQALRRPGGTRVLRPVQAAALTELHDFGGLFGPIPCGQGKTDVSVLAPKVLGAKRPLLLIPAGMRKETERKYKELQVHWVLPQIRMENYETISRVQGEKILDSYRPDLIVADECFGRETLVVTDRGPVSIGDIVDKNAGQFVLSGSGSWQRIVRRIRRPGYRDMVRVTHENGFFVCTPEHKIWTERGYVEAKNLTSDDHLQSLQSTFCSKTFDSVYVDDVLLSPLLGNRSTKSASTDRLQAMRSDVHSERNVGAGSVDILFSTVRRSGPTEKRFKDALQILQSAFHSKIRTVETTVVLLASVRYQFKHKTTTDLSMPGVWREFCSKRPKRSGNVLFFELRSDSSTKCQSKTFDLKGLSSVPGRFLDSEIARENTNVLRSGVFMEGEWPKGIQTAKRSTKTECLSSDAVRSKSHAQSRVRCENGGQDERPHVLVPRGQRAVNSTAIDVGELASRNFDNEFDRACCFGAPHLNEPSQDTVRQLTPGLQGGHRTAGTAGSDRGRREDPPTSQVEVFGSTKNFGAQRSRVVCVEVLQREMSERHCASSDRDFATYDLEIENEHNYFADGVLVSNCHRLKHSTAAATRRVKRYMNENPNTRFVALSGTMTRNSLHEYWHILRWCLGERGMPLPADWQELSQWADCLDVGTGNSRMAPGALELFCNEEEKKDLALGMEASLTAVRKAYQRRLTETPGVISMGEEQLACSLVIDELRVDLDHLAPYFKHLRTKWRTPDGHPFEEPVDLWRHARELTCGFFLAWWDQKRFRAGVQTALASEWSASERRLLTAIACFSALDVSLLRAVTNLLAVEANEVTSDIATGSLTSRDKPLPPPEQIEEVLEWLVAATPDSSRVELASGRLIGWETVLRGHPALLPALAQAIDAARPPKQWLWTRQLWSKFVRMQLSKKHAKLDTELQVVMAVTKCQCGRWRKDHEDGIGPAPETKTRLTCEKFRAGQGDEEDEEVCGDCGYDEPSHVSHVWAILPACKKFRPQLEQTFHDEELDETYENVWDNWATMRETYKPVVETVWIDDTVLRVATEWLKEHKGIAWVEHPSVGKKLSEIAGVPYYGEGGNGRQYKPNGVVTPVGFILDEKGPCVASIKANGTGRNLQHYSEGLLVSTPPNGAILEQLLARFHRPGQLEDEVRFTLILACKEQLFGFYRAMKDARYIQETTGNSQKLLYADVTVMSVDEAMTLQGPLWK